MKTWLRDSAAPRRVVARCGGCHELIVDVEQVGWLDPRPGHSYDVCGADPYGHHRPG